MNLGYLGFGNMGSALAEGLARFCPAVQSGEVTQYAWAPHTDKLRVRASECGVTACAGADELTTRCDTIILACKPYQVEDALRGLRLGGKAVVSVVSGWSFAALKALVGDSVRVQCIMPNTPVKVGKGTILLAEENDLGSLERERLKRLLGSVAALVELPEAKISAASAISGCGPAFLYMVIEALGDAGVKNGLARRDAYELAASTMVGAGAMVLDDPAAHPGALKDAVCSPGGLTIRGVAALEQAGMRGAFIEAVDATLEPR